MRKKNKRKSGVYSLVTLLVLLVGSIMYAYQYFQNQKNRQDVPVVAPTKQPLAKTTPTATATNTSTSTASTSKQATNNAVSLTQIPYVERAKLTVKRAEQLIEHLGYTVSYNPEWNIPNWVAYELTSVETSGAEQRTNHFKPDPLVKGDPVVTKDYSNSGYDRGHMAPAADMRWSEQAMKESFYMTNMCPQLHSLNAGDWKSLEELARNWAEKYGNIYIATGPIVEKPYKTIGKQRKIVVPQSFYKVFLRRKNNGDWTCIGFVMENKAESKPLMTYMHSVDEVEKLTGLDFFYNLPDEVENIVEADFDVGDWTLKK